MNNMEWYLSSFIVLTNECNNIMAIIIIKDGEENFREAFNGSIYINICYESSFIYLLLLFSKIFVAVITSWYVFRCNRAFTSSNFSTSRTMR